jgi:hypothetical protein
MKIAFLSPLLFLAAIIVGLVLSFAITAYSVPHPVETPVIVITPVPTPAPVYINPSPTSDKTVIPDNGKWTLTPSNSTDIVNMLPQLILVSILATAAMGLLIGLVPSVGRDR